MELFKKAIAEMIGTCVLVVIGCGVAVTTGCSAMPASSLPH
jgi:glycerol uptake facilitator-like aquaporin